MRSLRLASSLTSAGESEVSHRAFESFQTVFDKRRHFQSIGHELLIQDVAALDTADHRAIALQYLTFEQLVLDSERNCSIAVSAGHPSTAWSYHPRLARDRRTEHGGYDYSIHMRDASHPERKFVEWVDPQVGKQRDAELCQAYAFGISLDRVLSIEQDSESRISVRAVVVVDHNVAGC